MTKKRFKFGLAILGGLTAFLLALLALVFAPTGASAGKGPVFGQEQDGGGQSSDHPNLAYFEPPGGTGLGNGSDHSESGVGPCVGTLCDSQDSDAPAGETWHYADGEGGQGGNSQGTGHSPNSGDHSQGGNGNPWLFAGAGAGGGGYPGGGTPNDQSNACASQKDKDADSKDKSGDKKTCDSDNKDGSNSSGGDNNSDNGGTGNGGNGAGFQPLTLTDDKNSDDDKSGDDKSGDPSGDTNIDLVSNDPPPGDDDLPPVDPNCFPFTEGCDTHNGNPPNGNPPDTVLTDPPNKIPEPLTLSLFAVGLTGTAALRRRQKKAARPD